MQENTALARQCGYFGDRLNRTDFIIGMHDRYQHRILAQTILQLREVDQSMAIHR